MTTKQKYHHYSKWEDYQNGMWRKATKKEESSILPIAIEFTGNHKIYGSWMLKVIDEWPIACEHNLTDLEQNRKAWIGHAACCLCHKIPESITRMAWGYLTKEQQDNANIAAEIAIKKWEEKTGFGGSYGQKLLDM